MLRASREREHRLLMRHRWFSGAVAVAVSGALIFSGVTPAAADEAPPPPDTTVSTTDAATPPDPSVPPETPAAPTAPAEPAPDPVDPPTPDEAMPAEPSLDEAGGPGIQQQSLVAPLADVGITPLALLCAGWPAVGSPVAGFEIDGNLCLDGAGTADWATVGGQPVRSDGYDDSTQWTQGASENNWPWSVGQTGGSGTATGQSDIGNVYAYTQTVSGNVFTYFGFERNATSGTIGYYIELNQQPNSFGPVPARSVGDLRLVISQNGNVTIALVSASRWDGTKWVSLGSLAGFVGRVNLGDIDNLSGDVRQSGAFAEVAINLTALFGTAGCSGNYGVLNVRSNSSADNDNSSMKDWISPVPLNVPSTCSSLTILKTDTHGTPLAGAEFTIAPNPATGTGSTTGTTDANGKIVFSGSVQPDKTYTVTETTAPTGYLLPAVVSQQVLIGKAESQTVVFEDPLGSVRWLKHDQDGALLGGATFEVKATSGAATEPVWNLDASPLSVLDNTGQPGYSGRDVDPTPGEFEVVDLPTGTYALKETAAPLHYESDPDTAAFTIDSTTPHAVVATPFVNVLIVGTLRIEKALDGIPLAGLQNASFSGTWSCTWGSGPGQETYEGTWSVTGIGSATLTGPYTKLPLTSSCTVAETTPSNDFFVDASYTWTAPTISPSPVAISSTTVPATVTVTNNVQRSSLTLDKVVTNDFGGTLTDEAWDDKLHAGAFTFEDEQTMFLPAGPYALSEDAVPGYAQVGTVTCETAGGTPVAVTDGTVTLAAGQAVVCTFTNVDIAPKLTLKKIVENKNGIGTRASTEWTLSATGTVGFSEQATQNVTSNSSTTTTHAVRANTPYTLSESDIPGYSPSAWQCNGGTFSGGQITLAPGDDVTCAITNTVKTHTVTLRKEWVDALTDASASLTITAGERTSAPKTSTVEGAASFLDTVNLATLEVAEGSTVNLSEVVTGPGAYASALECTQDVVPAKIEGADRNQSIVVPEADVVCTYTNTANAVNVSLTKIWADDSFPADIAKLTITRGGEYLGEADSQPTDDPAITLMRSARIGDTVTLAETFGSLNTGEYDTSWECTGGVTVPEDGELSTGPILVTGAFECTVTNTPKTVTVTVNKEWVDGFTDDVANISVNGTPGASKIDGESGSETDLGVVTKVVRIGEAVNITETLPDSNTGRYDAQYRCGTAGYAVGATIPSIVKIQTDMTCWFQNTARERTVTLQKQWVDAIAGDEATLSIDGAAGVVSEALGTPGSQLDLTHVATAEVRVGEVIDLTEDLDASSGSTYDTTYVCSPTGLVDSSPGAGTGFEITVADGEGDIVCTFVNTNVRGQITLLKDVVNDDGGDADDIDWTLHADGIVSLGGTEGDDLTDVFVPVGTYELSETDGPAGYIQTDLVCTGGQFTAAEGDEPATVAVAAASHVVCTFTNDDVAPTLTLVKHVVNTGGGISAATNWTLTATGPTTWAGATTGTTAEASTATQDVEANADYTLSETGPLGYTAGPWSCDEEGVLQGSVVNVPLDTDVTCEITNTAIPATGSHTKTVTHVSQDDQGVWTIVYDVVVTNDSVASTLTYDLDDELQFGSGVEIVDASWTGPSNPDPVPFDAEWSTALANDVPLPKAVGTHTYTVTVHATIAEFPGPDDTWEDCVLQPREEGTGFLNAATLTVGGTPTEQTACDAPEFPDVEKSAATPQQDPATGDWTVTYTIDVTTTGGDADPGVYAVVTDDLPDAPANWSLVDGTWHVTSGAGTPALDVQLPPGAQELFAGLIPAGSHHVYTVTGVLRPSAAAGALGDCDEGGGLVNDAVVTSGEARDESDACVEITPPEVSISKTVTDVEHLVAGPWRITYEIEVSNDSSLSAVYSLTDHLEFGGDLTVLPGSTWSGPTGGGGFALPAGEAVLATDIPLTGGASDVYTVTVLAQVDLADYAGDTIACEPQGSLEAGGFLNTATVVAGGVPQTADDCAEPALPRIRKDGIGARQNPLDASEWYVTYLITVTPSGFADTYRLDDFPGFPSGVSILGDGTAQRVDALLEPLGGSTPVAFAGTSILPSVAIAAAGEPHRYLVTWLVDVTNTFDVELGECVDGQAGTGFYNVATMTVGGIPLSDPACVPVREVVFPTIGKTVTSAVQDPATGEWTITYDIVVTLPANEAGDNSEYSLTDALDFGEGISVTDASWAGPNGAAGDGFDEESWTATLATDRLIEDGTSHLYTVTAHADVTQTAIDEGTTVCTTGQAGGFLNIAELTAFGQTLPAEDCAAPALPDIVKSGESSVRNDDGTWTVSYLVTVSHDGTVQDPAVGVGYVLTDAPDALPDGVELADGETWHAAAADAGTPDPADADWTYGEAEWVIATGALEQPGEGAVSSHVYRVSAVVEVADAPDAEAIGGCADLEETGILLVNRATVASGDVTATDDGCTVVHYDDVSLVKSSSIPVTGSVEPGEAYTYTLAVTNNGTAPAAQVHVRDASFSVAPYIDRLDVTRVIVPGLPDQLDPANNIVDVTLPGTLGAGQTVLVTVEVTFLPSDTGDATTIPNLVGEDPVVPPFEPPLSQIVNRACVDAEHDPLDESAKAANNCDSETVQTRDMTGIVYTRCVSDAPYLGFFIRTTPNLANLPVTATWTTVTEPAVSGHSLTLDSFTAGVGGFGRNDIPWPGAEFTPSGVAIDYPGWRQLEASDYGPGGGFINPADGIEYTREQATTGISAFVFNGLILDPSELDYAWRLPAGTTVVFSVNPTLTFEVAYPDATPECTPARESNVVIEKDASVAQTTPGSAFDYTLAVQNVTDDSAADGVMVSDAIPADIKITDVSWTGEGDASVFPNWDTCAVSGQNASGYGGTLTCALFGPLQPGESAPTITLAALVSASSTASRIDNVGVVDYYTFDHPEDTGRDADDATVLLSPLAVTGSALGAWALWSGLGAVLGGITLLYITRRRRTAVRSAAE